ncbi:MAG: 3'-5' exonuclease [Acetobacteraceae bacterium]|nr:3'-5' exonuclease [Acetobacteraceae bacterium]
MQPFWRRWSARGAAPAPAPPLPDGPLDAVPYVAFDLETTGLRPSRGDAILQIGAVRWEAGRTTGTFSSLVRPHRAIPAASTRYHGITDAMVADAPSPQAAVGAFRDFAAGAVLVAHNAAFDATALARAAERGAPALPNPVLCSMVLAGSLDPREGDLSLDGLCGRAGIVIAGRHQALADAQATLLLWLALLARASASGIADLPELAARTRMAQRIAERAVHF